MPIRKEKQFSVFILKINCDVLRVSLMDDTGTKEKPVMLFSIKRIILNLNICNIIEDAVMFILKVTSYF